MGPDASTWWRHSKPGQGEGIHSLLSGPSISSAKEVLTALLALPILTLPDGSFSTSNRMTRLVDQVLCYLLAFCKSSTRSHRIPSTFLENPSAGAHIRTRHAETTASLFCGRVGYSPREKGLRVGKFPETVLQDARGAVPNTHP